MKLSSFYVSTYLISNSRSSDYYISLTSPAYTIDEIFLLNFLILDFYIAID